MPKNKKKQKHISQSTAALKSNGLQAFHQNDFKKAIAAWEKMPSELRPAAWLSEAHFRRGMTLFYGSDDRLGLIDLQAAKKYQPDDPCYAYHTGLVLHRLGDVSGALSAYQTAHKNAGPFAKRAAYPLALALLQTGQDVTMAPVWKELTASEKAMLRSASAFQRRPYHLPIEAPPLWRALAALDRNNNAQARIDLEQVKMGDSSPAEKAVGHYYQGVLAARAEDWVTALQAWEAASDTNLPSAHLRSNLVELYQRQAEDLLTQGDAEGALAAAEKARQHNPGDNALNELSSQIHQQLGYLAAGANRWDEAQFHWLSAVKLDTSSFRLAYNLALSYEKSGDYLLAGQTWREALRRRPRRADHPDALSDDQVARVWQRTAECYRKAGEFTEVGRTYQQAIKWAPENMDLRLSLSESLIMDGRMLAARNELERVLEHDPKNVPALLRLGEAYFRDEDSAWDVKERSKTYWEKVLQIEPKNTQAKQLLGEWYLDQGEIAYSWDNFEQAIENYRKALEFRPKNIQTLVYLAECYFELDDHVHGEEYAGQALAFASNFDDYAEIIIFWLSIKYDERALEITVLAEARFGKVPTDFYISMAEKDLKDRRKSEALRWLQRAIEKADPNENVLVMIGEMAMDIDPTLAKETLQKALDVQQQPGQVHLMLGILESRQNNKTASKKHFSEAERIARETKDVELANRIEAARMLAKGPQAILQHLMDIGGHELLDKFLYRFGGEFDDD
jgi:tetratricopeptide (TPR) repeat protein